MKTKEFFTLLITALFLALASASALAAGAGVVTHLSGTLSVQRPDGTVRILSQKSQVNPGDLLTTQRDSFAQINFTDGSAATMRPETTMKIEAYTFVQEKPQGDAMFMRLLKGGLRTVTGLIGKRGDQDAYRIGTSTATIGIRGSSGETVECLPGTCGKLPQGTYHTTFNGSYIMQNKGGTQLINEGQFGFAQDPMKSPVLLPGDPGLNLGQMPFTLGIGGTIGGGSQECVVR
ncbi:MAG: FecR domain-containing protein [Betaproteobacteria bacterium]|jgi:hypothetical protein|nr:FecR domain-containing protein [Betaproteobacteria bacterium]